MPDNKYCYPDSEVLKNKLNIIDKNKLFEAEKELTAIRLKELQDKPIKGKFDFKHLKAIHKYIFQDIYDWAGKERLAPSVTLITHNSIKRELSALFFLFVSLIFMFICHFMNENIVKEVLHMNHLAYVTILIESNNEDNFEPDPENKFDDVTSRKLGELLEPSYTMRGYIHDTPIHFEADAPQKKKVNLTKKAYKRHVSQLEKYDF